MDATQILELASYIQSTAGTLFFWVSERRKLAPAVMFGVRMVNNEGHRMVLSVSETHRVSRAHRWIERHAYVHDPLVMDRIATDPTFRITVNPDSWYDSDVPLMIPPYEDSRLTAIKIGAWFDTVTLEYMIEGSARDISCAVTAFLVQSSKQEFDVSHGPDSYNSRPLFCTIPAATTTTTSDPINKNKVYQNYMIVCILLRDIPGVPDALNVHHLTYIEWRVVGDVHFERTAISHN